MSRSRSRIRRRERSSIGGTLLALCAALLAAFASPSAQADESQASLKRAERHLKDLKRFLGRRSQAGEAHVAMEEAARGFAALTPPPRPDLVAQDPGGSAAAADAAAKENERRLRLWGRASARFAKQEDALERRWLVLLGQALRVDSGRMRNGMDLSLSINRRALELLVATQHADAATVLTEAIRHWLKSENPVAAARFHIAAFEALPRLHAPDALDWLVATFVGKEDEFPEPIHVKVREGGVVVEELVADLPVLALQAMARHADQPGALRLRAVKKLVAAHAPLEERADRGGVHAQLWDRLGGSAVDAAWALAGRPLDGFAATPPRMADLVLWLAANRSADAPAWRD